MDAPPNDLGRGSASLISDQEVMAQLTRVLKSSHFVQSARLSRFLDYTVQRVLAGKPQDLKEYTIGVEVYGRKPPYHPNEDSIVRTEARRLRNKLKQYYEGEGKGDRIQFYFRLGSYAPVFREVQADTRKLEAASISELPHSPPARGILFVVFPFIDATGTHFTFRFARGLTDEVIHHVMRAEGCRAVAYTSLQHLVQKQLDAATIAQKFGAQVALEGTVREDGERVRVTCTFVSLPGLERWSERFEGTRAQAFFELEEQMAAAITGRFAPHSLEIKRQRRNATPREVAYYPELLACEAQLDRSNKSSIQHALEDFIRIDQEQPLCARAACGIAQSYYSLAMLGEPLDPRSVANCQRAADRALAIDPELMEAHAAHGCARMLQLDLPAAEISFQQCIRLGSSAPALCLYGDLLTSRGRFEEAYQILDRAQEIDPFCNRQKIATLKFLYMSRRYDDALAYRSTRAKYGPTTPDILLFEALAYVGLGRTNDAARVAAEIVRGAAGALPSLADACGILYRSGNRSKALALCNSFRLLDAGTPISAVRKALLALASEDFRVAAVYFEQAFRVGEADFSWLGVDPRCDKMAEIPYFNSFLQSSLLDGPTFPYSDIATIF